MIVMSKSKSRACHAIASSAIGLAAVSGCAATASASHSTEGAVPISAAFYPLQFAVEQVGGARVHVASLTKPGGEPHDLELTPKDLATLTKAQFVVYEGGFQPAVDDAVKGLNADTRLDVAGAATLDIAASEGEGGHGQDPHFWLDPIRYATVGKAIGERLAKADPAHAQEYRSNAQAFAAKLNTLDQEFSTGLAKCTIKDLVTGHAAFAYLSARYGLHQDAITISPEQEPTAAQMRDVTNIIRKHGVTTVYSETLVSPAIAETVARETGAKLAVLDPIEGITKASAGTDYFQVTASNLATLKKGQDCS